jgi:hypothetical protein
LAGKKTNRADIKARNAKIQAGIQKDLTNIGPIQLAGVAYTPSSLSAVFQTDSDAIDAAENQRKALQQAVLTQKQTHAKTAIVLSALRSFLLGYFGRLAVAILGDFGFNAPKTTPKKTVATKAAAVVKGKATRAARGTMGSVKKKSVKGNLDTTKLEAAINDPLASPIDAPVTSNAETPPAGPAAPAVSPAPTPAAPHASNGGTSGNDTTSGPPPPAKS